MIVFLGGGGAGLSALVNIFYELGFNDILVVDKFESEITEKLKKKGIKVIIGDNIYDFKKDDIIIYSDAVVNSKDFQKIKDNIKFTYFDFVGEISKWFQTIAIAGTHGKTSTTSIAISSAKKLNFKNLALGIVGGFVADLENNNYFVNQDIKNDIKLIFEKILSPKGARPSHLFKKYYFIIEADEFNRHFLLLDSYISLITKVDHDHKDIYPNESDYLQAFAQFINKTRYKIFTNDKDFSQKIKDFKINKNIEFVEKDEKILENASIFGEHMKKNATLVKKLFLELGFEENKIKNAIQSFKGVWRRQEYLGKIKNLKIYTDYAHHPIEIEATYSSFRNNFKNFNLIGIFQAHQLFRFVSYEKDFMESLKKFDKIFIYDIYSVREENLLQKLAKEKNINTENNKKIIETIGNEIAEKLGGEYIKDFETLIKKIENLDGIAVIMSAGDLDYKIRKFMN